MYNHVLYSCIIIIRLICTSLCLLYTQPETNIFAYVSTEDFKKLRKVSHAFVT